MFNKASILLCAATVILAGRFATAQDITPAAYNNMVDVLEEQSRQLKEQSGYLEGQAGRIQALEASWQDGGVPAAGGCTTCGSPAGCNCSCNVDCGWFAGYELVIVKPHFENGVDRSGGVLDDPRFDLAPSHRLWFGNRDAEGRSWRLRYYQYNQTADGPPDATSMNLEVQTVDAEINQLVCWGPMQMEFTGGIRYGHISDVQGNDGFLQQHDFNGFGPTVALEAILPSRWCDIDLVGNFRVSLLYGTDRLDSTGDGRIDDLDDLVSSLEIQLGAQKSYCLANGGTVTLRALMEAQYWNAANEDFGDGDLTSVDDDFGLFGAALSLIYQQ